MDIEDRVVSFSVPPSNKEARAEIKKLQEYSERTGVKFSFLMIQAVKAKNKELGL